MSDTNKHISENSPSIEEQTDNEILAEFLYQLYQVASRELPELINTQKKE